MITPAHAQLMARYNRWQNSSIYAAAGQVVEAERRRDQGAFFGSIHATLNHLLWADQSWLHRFSGMPAPAAKRPKDSVAVCEQWDDLARERRALDDTILGWAGRLEDDWLSGNLTWFSGAAGRELSRPRWQLVAHFFNHQTHHRGQVHAMLTRLGAKPEDTDLMLIE
jgi:uncharacterized damage-inducible protein DinB